jgi:hypothetical protein
MAMALSERSAEVAGGPPSRGCEADRGHHDRQQRASNTDALQQAAGEQRTAPDDSISARRAARDITQLSDAELIAQLAQQAKELGIEIDLNYSFAQPQKDPDK